jgi:hypothetical protein
LTELDGAVLMTLLTADPAERQAKVQQMLLERLGGDSSQPGLLSALSGTGATAPDDVDDAPPALDGLYREASLLSAELRRVTALLAEAARALGACPRCLGTDERCEVCGGAGTPGAEVPDVERFEHHVAPAVRRLADEAGPIDHFTEKEGEVT